MCRRRGDEAKVRPWGQIQAEGARMVTTEAREAGETSGRYSKKDIMRREEMYEEKRPICSRISPCCEFKIDKVRFQVLGFAAVRAIPESPASLCVGFRRICTYENSC